MNLVGCFPPLDFWQILLDSTLSLVAGQTVSTDSIDLVESIQSIQSKESISNAFCSRHLAIQHLQQTPPSNDVAFAYLRNDRLFNWFLKNTTRTCLLVYPANFDHDHEDRRPCFPLDKRCRFCAGTEGRQ